MAIILNQRALDAAKAEMLRLKREVDESAQSMQALALQIGEIKKRQVVIPREMTDLQTDRKSTRLNSSH